MPVRKIPLRTRSLSGIRATPKSPRGIAFESALERDFIDLCSFDPSVSSIEEQPVRMPIPALRGRNRSYVPDFLIQYTKAQRPNLLCEIKYAEELRKKRDDFRQKFHAAEAFSREHGWNFKVITEQDIRGQRLENIKFLLAFQGRTPDHDREARILHCLEKEGALPAKIVLEKVWPDDEERTQGIPSLWRLAANHLVETDMDAPLSMNCTIHLARGGAQWQA